MAAHSYLYDLRDPGSIPGRGIQFPYIPAIDARRESSMRIVHFSSAAQRIGVLFDVIVWLERTFIRQAHMTYQGIRLGMSAPPPENLFGHDHPKFPFQESVRNVARPRDFAWWIGGCVIDLTIFIKL